MAEWDNEMASITEGIIIMIYTVAFSKVVINFYYPDLHLQIPSFPGREAAPVADFRKLLLVLYFVNKLLDIKFKHTKRYLKMFISYRLW